jgi:hypothetical protein
MANQVFARNALTGGGAGAIDTIDGSKLADGDLILTAVPATRILYAHILDADSGAAEASPVTISPDTNAGNKRHVMATLAALGLAFPAAQVASADANTFDDYEKGNWTPSIKFGGASVGMTYTTQAGYYTKLGRVVILTGTCVLSAKGSSTGDVSISGFPFTSSNNDGAVTIATLYFSGISFANQYQAYIPKNGSSLYLYEITESGTVTALTEGNVADTSLVRILAVYFV